ncbi:hypothetical protein DPMN_045584 [Dreissena polymorpha]|uniref:Uncharacterized protein n=1 Tax=Dreissena polymorpha TaxID=45954 RepID=A0A9D4HXH6_DREPO|nr:hypothetical protein DPMN_045584 [Dreissena polymorpha]
MSNTGPQFCLSRDAFAARSKSIKRQCKGNKPKAASPLTDDEIETLYQKQILCCHTPNALPCGTTTVSTLAFGEPRSSTFSGLSE